MELAGIDPERDVEVLLEGDVLHIRAERHEEEKAEGRYFFRREHRYGSFLRDVRLPKAASEGDVHATYKDGILELRVAMKDADLRSAKKIPIAKR